MPSLPALSTTMGLRKLQRAGQRKLLVAAAGAVLMAQTHRHFAAPKAGTALGASARQLRKAAQQMAGSIEVIPIVAGVVDHHFITQPDAAISRAGQPDRRSIAKSLSATSLRSDGVSGS